MGLDERAGAVAAAEVVGVPDERVAPKRDMVALAGVVGVPAPVGVRFNVEDGGVPLVGVVAMFDFSLVESEDPNRVEAATG